MDTFYKKLQEIDALFSVYKKRKLLTKEEQSARYEQLRLKWTYHSNALEGNTLTLGETAFYLREGLTSEGKPLEDYLAARNHAEAIDWIGKWANPTEPITEGFLKELNALLHKGITELPAQTEHGAKVMRPITPGAYKKHPSHVLTLSGEIHHYAEPLQVPAEMEKLIAMLAQKEGQMHVVELASKAHIRLTQIHPFDDCNGRSARILLNLLFMRAGYPPIIIKTEERRAYLSALESADNNDKLPFLMFIAQHVMETLK